MIKVYFSIGNDYHCSCCRVTEEYEHESETPELAVSDCVDMARGTWDIHISLIEGVEDPEALETLIYKAVEEDRVQAAHTKRIKGIRDRITENQRWLDNQEAEALRRRQMIEAAQKELAELGEAI